MKRPSNALALVGFTLFSLGLCAAATTLLPSRAAVRAHAKAVAVTA